MTPLGVGAEHCRKSLERYRQRLSQLAGLLSVPRAALPGSDALMAFDDLASQLEVDTLARRGAGAAERMSEAESELFAPAVRQAHRDLVALSGRQPSGWLPTLTAIDRALAAVDADLQRWQRQVGVD